MIVSAPEQGQRFDKYLRRKLPAAPSSFIYKMLRKKNITLNGSRAEGGENVRAGDEVVFFLSDETYAKFSGTGEDAACGAVYRAAYAQIGALYRRSPVIYEDAHILLADKKPGILSQKARPEDISMNEWFVGCLLARGEATETSLEEFTPSVCNRLDRNTGGILICAKTLAGSRAVSELLRTRSLRKFYRMVVRGHMQGNGRITGYIRKDPRTNQVEVLPKAAENAPYSETRYRALKYGKNATLLECELVTGKTHQLRAHLAHRGNPIGGDPKYGDTRWNDELRSRYGVRHQLLYACRIEFPLMEGELVALSRRSFLVPVPAVYGRIIAEDADGNMEFQRP